MTREEAIRLLGFLGENWHGLYLQALDMAITSLMAQHRWIRVEERLPNDNEKVIVYTRSGKMCVARWSARQDKFVSSGNLTVTHWMLLPNEPKTEVRCEFAENGVDGSGFENA